MTDKTEGAPGELSQDEKRETVLNDARVREQGATLAGFAQAEVETMPRDRFSQVNAATVIGAKPNVAAAYPAASTAHQTELPPEPSLGLSIEEQEPIGTPAEVQASIDKVSPLEPSSLPCGAQGTSGDPTAPSNPTSGLMSSVGSPVLSDQRETEK